MSFEKKNVSGQGQTMKNKKQAVQKVLPAMTTTQYCSWDAAFFIIGETSPKGENKNAFLKIKWLWRFPIARSARKKKLGKIVRFLYLVFSV
jgi:hypothetical protein